MKRVFKAWLRCSHFLESSQIEKAEGSSASKDPDAGSSIDAQSCETSFHTRLGNPVDRLTSASNGQILNGYKTVDLPLTYAIN